jgi:hypothetical protein
MWNGAAPFCTHAGFIPGAEMRCECSNSLVLQPCVARRSATTQWWQFCLVMLALQQLRLDYGATSSLQKPAVGWQICTTGCTYQMQMGWVHVCTRRQSLILDRSSRYLLPANCSAQQVHAVGAAA